MPNVLVPTRACSRTPAASEAICSGSVSPTLARPSVSRKQRVSVASARAGRDGLTARQPALVQRRAAARLDGAQLGPQARLDLAGRGCACLQHVDVLVEDHRRDAVGLLQLLEHRQRRATSGLDLRAAHGATAVEHQSDRQRRPWGHGPRRADANAEVDVAEAAASNEPALRAHVERDLGRIATGGLGAVFVI